MIFPLSHIQAPILVFRNEIRTQLNYKAAIHNAQQLHYPLMVRIAKDICQGKPVKDPVLIKKTIGIAR